MKWNIHELKELKRYYADKRENESDNNNFFKYNMYYNEINDLIYIFNNQERKINKRIIDDSKLLIENSIEKAKRYLSDNPQYLYLIKKIFNLRYEYNGNMKNIEITDEELIKFLKLYSKSNKEEILLNKVLDNNNDMFFRRENYKGIGTTYPLENGKGFICLNKNHNLFDYLIITHETEHMKELYKYDYTLPNNSEELRSCTSNIYGADLVKDIGYESEYQELQNYNTNLYLRKTDFWYSIINFIQKNNYNGLTEEQKRYLLEEFAENLGISYGKLCAYIFYIPNTISHYIGFILGTLIHDNYSIDQYSSVIDKYVKNSKPLNKTEIDESIKILKKQI